MIQLPGGYAMTADENSYIVGIPFKEKKRGRDNMRNRMYYTSVASALEGTLRRLVREKVHNESITELRQVVEEINTQRQRLEELLRPLE